MKISKLATLFPPMTKEESQSLCDDIAKNGVIEPIWIYNDEIIDGRHRYECCQKLGIDCPTREYTGDDVLGFVLSLNMHRRHLNASQRALIAAELASLSQGQKGGITQAEAAQIMNTSVRSVQRAKQIEDEEEKEAIRSGEKTLNKVIKNDRKTNTPIGGFDTNNLPEQEEEEIDFVQMCDDLQREVERCHKLLDSDDTMRDLDKLSKAYSQLEGRLQAQITEASEAKQQAKYYKSILDKVIKKLGIDSYKDILDFI